MIVALIVKVGCEPEVATIAPTLATLKKIDLAPEDRPKWRSIAVCNLYKVGTC